MSKFDYIKLEKVWGTAGIDVCGAYIFQDGEIDIVTKSNTHYGYGFGDDDGLIYDKSNRSCFKIA